MYPLHSIGAIAFTRISHKHCLGSCRSFCIAIKQAFHQRLPFGKQPRITLILSPFIYQIFSETLDNLFFTLRFKPFSILKLRIASGEV